MTYEPDAAFRCSWRKFWSVLNSAGLIFVGGALTLGPGRDAVLWAVAALLAFGGGLAARSLDLVLRDLEFTLHVLQGRAAAGDERPSWFYDLTFRSLLRSLRAPAWRLSGGLFALGIACCVGALWARLSAG